MVCCTGRGSFVVDLVADDGLIVLVVFENLAAHAFAIKSVSWVRKIRVLAVTVIKVLPTEARHDNLWMFPIEPGGNGSGRRANDDADPSGAELIHHAIHPGEFKFAVFRLPQPPTEFPDADDRDACLLHQLDILVYPFVWHVFRIIRNAVQDSIHAVGAERFAGLGFSRQGCAEQANKEKSYSHQPRKTCSSLLSENHGRPFPGFIAVESRNTKLVLRTYSVPFGFGVSRCTSCNSA